MSGRIDGLGVALVEVPRLERALLRFGARLERRLFVREELRYARGSRWPAERLAARLAAKLALRGALREKPRLGSIEVVRGDAGAPELRWPGSRPGVRAHLSLGHEGGLAVASVWIDRADGG